MDDGDFRRRRRRKKNRILLWLWLDCLLFLLAKVSVFMEVITRDYIEELDGGTEALRS